jgi:hypothetical protein
MPRCKHCKQTFEPLRFNQKFCLKSECIAKGYDEHWKKRKKETSIDVHSQKHKTTLQNEINKLSRMIDEHCSYVTCIDCDTKLDRQVHGAHFHNVKGNENIRYNLHNIHSATSQCNRFDSEHKIRYQIGLVNRYGLEYFEYVSNEIPQKYKSVHLTNKEIFEAIAVVRKLQRTLHTYKSKDGCFLRTICNNIIGFYK